MTLEGVYGSKTGVPIEDLFQQILDRAYGEGNADLIVPVSPGFVLIEYYQEEMTVEDALRRIADQILWEVDFETPAPDFRPTITLRPPTG